MAYQRKTQDEYRVMANYGQGWEEVVAAFSRKEAREHLKTYRENEPRYSYTVTGPHRVELD